MCPSKSNFGGLPALFYHVGQTSKEALESLTVALIIVDIYMLILQPNTKHFHLSHLDSSLLFPSSPEPVDFLARNVLRRATFVLWG